MILLNSIEEFKDKFRVGKKWIRCQEAIENSKNICENVYYNIGDSLIYMLKTKFENKDECFQGHRRYLDIHVYLEGEEKVEIALKKSLKESQEYSNETDCEYFLGNGENIVAKKGQVIIFENSEAFRFKENTNLKKIIIKVTVEDNFLLNK